MPTPAATQSFPLERKATWEFSEGAEEYAQLLRVLRAARGSFYLFLIESNYEPALRDRLLDCLQNDLAADLCLRRVELTASNWDVLYLSLLETSAETEEAIVLIGLENTPGLVAEPGRAPTRPPVFALLNRLRETLHRHVPGPFLVWCTPSVYTGLQTYAPDFFDHYTGLFQFMKASRELQGDQGTPTIKTDPISRPVVVSAAARRLVEFYEQQLKLYPEATLDRVDALLGLADALLDVQDLKTSDHVMAAFSFIQEALTILSREHSAYKWARAQVIKGSAYANLPVGDRGQNLQQAIACHKTALQVYTEQDFPQAWAGTQNNLANAYCGLPTGDRGKNLKRAITCYEAALRVRTEEQFPQEWAAVQNNMAVAYGDLPTGDRGENLKRAITCYEAALRVRTEEQFPQDWAMTQNNLANAYCDLPTGDRGENLKRAITCYEAALRVRTEEHFPQDWAATQNNLANAYCDLPTGDRGENFKCAITCYEAALHVYTEERFPQDWAMTQNNLAIAYRNLPTGDLGENVQRAITCYEAALHVYTEERFPQQWAMTQNNIAIALNELGRNEEVKEAWRNAVRGYLRVGMEEAAQRIERYLQSLG